MPLDPIENFINVEVAGTHTSGDTTVSLANAEASKLPDPANGEYNLVWYDSTNYSNPTFDPNVEIVRVTTRDTGNDNVDVNRGQENTNASDKNSSGSTYRMALVPTAKTIEDIQAALNNISSFTWRGAWQDGNSYAVDDMVEVDGSSYVAIADHTASSSNKPGSGGSWQSNWDLLVQGTPGSSDTPSFNAYDSTGGQDVTSASTVAINTVRENIGSLINYSSGTFTAQKDTKVLVSFYVSTINSSNGSRSSSQAWLEVDTGSGWTEVPGTRINLYNRNNNEGRATGSGDLVYDVSSGDVFRVRAERAGGGDSISTIADGSGIVFSELSSQPGPRGPKGEPGTINSNAIITESDGISNNDNDSSIPTSAAVYDQAKSIAEGVLKKEIQAVGTAPTPVAIDSNGVAHPYSADISATTIMPGILISIGSGSVPSRTNYKAPNTASGFNFTVPAGDNRYIVLYNGEYYQGSVPSGAEWGTNSMTQVYAGGAGKTDGGMFYLDVGSNSSDQTKTITVNNGSSATIVACFEDVAGVGGSGGDSSSGNVSFNLSVQRGGSLLVGGSSSSVMGEQGRWTFSPTSLWNLIAVDNNDNTAQLSQGEAPSDGSQSVSHSTDNGYSATAAAVELQGIPQTGEVKFAGVVGGFSGLTVGSVHYLQNDGTLGTSPGSNTITVGVAISSSQILIARN